MFIRLNKMRTFIHSFNVTICVKCLFQYHHNHAYMCDLTNGFVHGTQACCNFGLGIGSVLLQYKNF
jgi:hypothetical protein